MDRPKGDRGIRRIQASHGQIEAEAVVDRDHDHYGVMHVGWDGARRVLPKPGARRRISKNDRSVLQSGSAQSWMCFRDPARSSRCRRTGTVRNFPSGPTIFN